MSGTAQPSKVTSITRAGHGAPGKANSATRDVAGVIVNDAWQVVEFLGSTSPYLQLPLGTPTFNLMAMVRPGLHTALREALDEAGAKAHPIRRRTRRLKPEGRFGEVDFEVQRVGGHSGKLWFRIIFEEVSPGDEKDAQSVAAQAAKRVRPKSEPEAAAIGKLRSDLESTKQYLESIIKEHEAVIDSLQRTRGDVEASNQELEAAHAEAEAINAELEAANQELEKANRDLDAAKEKLEGTVRERDRALRDRQRLEAKMLQTQKLESLGVLAGGIAHDFNNILVSVVGNASFLLEELGPNSPLRRAVEDIQCAGERAAELVDQILAYSGERNAAQQPCDLSALVGEMAGLLKSTISKKVSFEYHFAEGLPAVEADVSQVRQVAMNLITNASDAIGDQPGLIRIRTGAMRADRNYLSNTYVDDDLPAGRYVFFEVADNGCGMDEKTKKRMFDPFFTTRLKGRGLGLAAVVGIVRAHRGAIKVDSEQYYGTTFRILFPASLGTTDGPGGRETSVRTAVPGASGTVLVVDDELPVLSLATLTLERAGFQVLSADDGCEALRLFRERASDIAAIVLDLTMPAMSGPEVLREIRAIRPDVRVVLSSGYNKEITGQALRIDAETAFLQKPYRASQLVDKVHDVLNRA